MLNEDNNPWYRIGNIQELDSPALVVYPQRVSDNIKLLLSMIDDPLRLRPHVKTNKAKEPVVMMLRAGISKFKCATIAEAEMLAMCGAPDVLLAYQPEGPKLKRFVCLVKKYPATLFSCLTDNETSAKEMSGAFASQQLVVPVLIDLNTGMNRTGIKTGAHALALYQLCASLPGIKPVGLHLYDGHIHDTDLQVRKAQSDLVFDEATQLRNALVSFGYPLPFIVAGGSPTFPIHAKRPEVECSPGTFIYWDKGYQDLYPEQPFLPAAAVITRVISMPDATKICVDLGHKSVAAEKELSKRVYFLNAPGLLFVSHSEEHLVMDAGANHLYQIGDVLYGLPYHVCPTVALYEKAITIEAGTASGEWRTVARDRSIGC